MIKSFLSLLFKLSVTLGLLIYVAMTVDVSYSMRLILEASIPLVLLSGALVFINIFIVAGRWVWVLRSLGYRQRYVRSVIAHQIGVFFGLIVPGAVAGDAYRAIYCRKDGVPIGKIINAVLLDRALAVFALVVMAVVAIEVLYQ